MKTLDQISAQVYERAFDGSGADVYTNGDGLIRRKMCPVVGSVWAHNRCELYALYAILVGHPCRSLLMGLLASCRL